MQDIEIDIDNWPIVYVKVPLKVKDGAEVNYLKTMQSLLDRGEPIVMVYDGPEKFDSPAFNSAYMKWFKSVKEQLNKQLKGIVRIDPQNARNKSWVAVAKEKVKKMAIPYPYETCETFQQADALARTWLSNDSGSQ